MIFNITLIADDDGNAANSMPTVTVYQATYLRDLIKETNSNLDGFCRHFKIDSVDDLKEQAYSMAKDMLEQRRGKAQ